MLISEIAYSIYFYNPNIHPLREYEIRKEENIRFAQKHGIEFIDADYDPKNWFAQAKGMEFDPERGPRCSMCFFMRLEKSAEYAAANNFPVLATSLGISRWKNLEQVNSAGRSAASKWGIEFWDFNWRKGGGSQRMISISKREKFYMQQYCGCSYSLRDANLWRKQQGREAIKIGVDFYGENE